MKHKFWVIREGKKFTVIDETEHEVISGVTEADAEAVVQLLNKIESKK